METPRRQIRTLLAAISLLAAMPALADSIPPQDYRVPAEIAGSACGISDPTDPHRILGPNPAHTDCLTAHYPSVLAGGSFTGELSRAAEPGSASVPTPLTATTMWLLVAVLAMMILAGFNSRKRHRRLPVPGHGGGTLDTARETLHTHSEGARWHDD